MYYTNCKKKEKIKKNKKKNKRGEDYENRSCKP